MTKAVFAILIALALVTGLALRLARLDARPMHHDEANQAVKFGALLEAGDYRYDASDHHGPTLYYLTLPAAWLRGQTTLAALDETTVRLVPVAFGMALLLLILTLTGDLGRPATVLAVAFAAVSPALTYYSRFYIQEMAFACFSLAFLIAVGRYVQRPSMGAAGWTGFYAGLAMATKETWLITLPAALVACVAAGWQSWSFAPHLSDGAADLPGPVAAPPGRGAKLQLCGQISAALFVALLLACLFYSSFFTNPSGVGDWIRSFPIYGSRGLGGGRHDEPWVYYLHLLAFWRSGGLVFTEGLILLLGGIGIAVAVLPLPGRPGGSFWPRALSFYALITTFVFSAVPYKTPWNLVPFYVAVVVMAGCGAARLLELAGAQAQALPLRRRFVQAAFLAALGAGTWHLGVEAWRAAVRYSADPRNPYVYAQTTPDFLHLAARIEELAAVHAEGRSTLVEVLAGPYEQWPLPWYLRKLTRVGYWSRAAEAGALDRAPILVASQDNVAPVEAALGDRYVSAFYGLRPGVLLTLYVQRDLWNRFLETRR